MGHQKPGEVPTHQVKTFVHAPSPVQRTRAILTVTSGPDTGRVLALPPGAMVTFGRADTCSYSWPDGSLSRVHAVIAQVAGAHVLKDEGSTNGSFVNEQRVDKTRRLADGDRVQLGMHLTMRFSLVSEEEESALVRLYESAMRDGLTGTLNRKHLEERLEAEIAFAARHGTPLSVCMLDVDHFKNVNDTYGHLAGDAVLKHVAGVLGRGLRTEDVVGRWGGEEFLVVARGIGVTEGAMLAERMRAAIAATPATYEALIIQATASFGVASLACAGARRDAAGLVGVADARLYAAKQAGRNRVVAA